MFLNVDFFLSFTQHSRKMESNDEITGPYNTHSLRLGSETRNWTAWNAIPVQQRDRRRHV